MFETAFRLPKARLPKSFTAWDVYLYGKYSSKMSINTTLSAVCKFYGTHNIYHDVRNEVCKNKNKNISLFNTVISIAMFRDNFAGH